jgi:hypothetical protein
MGNTSTKLILDATAPVGTPKDTSSREHNGSSADDYIIPTRLAPCELTVHSTVCPDI